MEVPNLEVLIESCQDPELKRQLKIHLEDLRFKAQMLEQNLQLIERTGHLLNDLQNMGQPACLNCGAVPNIYLANDQLDIGEQVDIVDDQDDEEVIYVDDHPENLVHDNDDEDHNHRVDYGDYDLMSDEDGDPDEDMESGIDTMSETESTASDIDVEF